MKLGIRHIVDTLRGIFATKANPEISLYTLRDLYAAKACPSCS
jgi:hypothetical protein